MAMNRKTVAESMRRQGLRARAAKRFRRTTDSGHSLGVAPNLLAQDFSANRPDEKWAGDIEVEYNRTRRHSALGYLSPEAFEARIVA